MEKLIRATKRKDVSFGTAENMKVLEGREAAVLEIPALKQVTVTFLFQTKDQADEFFAKFQGLVRV